MSDFYPVMFPSEEVRDGDVASIGGPGVGNLTINEAELFVTTEGHVHPPQDPERLRAIAEHVGCSVEVGEVVEVDLGEGLGVVKATPVTVRTDRTVLSSAEMVYPYNSARCAALAGKHIGRVSGFGRIVRSEFAESRE